MNVRSQISAVFHLDKCIGCHTCSIACKNIWTDRKGTEYMWWNNVETRPGTGFPACWEDQQKFQGGWDNHDGRLELRSTSQRSALAELFHQPHQPTLDDYYEPWTYDYKALFDAPAGQDQPTARPLSMITGKPIDIESGPNWDDDLGGSPIYAENDPNLAGLPAEVRRQLFSVERLVFFYLPRICNHCLNPACVAACPSGALYKRGEDGVVLVDQKGCRSWRSCVGACPYKKVFYNWSTGKSEKCILCFPRLESGQAPACFHSCVGRIRYVGVLLYDADRIEAVAKAPAAELVEAQRTLFCDPHDPAVIASARANGVSEAVIEAAQRSPVYSYVKVWKIALPSHPEFRTLPSLFYVPPLAPVLASRQRGTLESASGELFPGAEQTRIPVQFLANLLCAGNQSHIEYALEKQQAIRAYRRAITVGDLSIEAATRQLEAAGSSLTEADAIYQMTALASFDERFVIPPALREMAIETLQDPLEHKQEMGFGFLEKPRRGF